MKYILKYSYYFIISLIFVILISLITWKVRIELLPIVLSNLYLLRILDDYYDFDTDKKEKILSKKQLMIIFIILSLIFVLLNVIFYKYIGIISLLFIIYIILENKFEFLKVFLLCIESIFYIAVYNSLNNVYAIIYLTICIMASIIFYIYKRRKVK